MYILYSVSLICVKTSFELWKQVKDQEATTLDTVQCIQQTITALQKVITLHFKFYLIWQVFIRT